MKFRVSLVPLRAAKLIGDEAQTLHAEDLAKRPITMKRIKLSEVRWAGWLALKMAGRRREGLLSRTRHLLVLFCWIAPGACVPLAAAGSQEGIPNRGPLPELLRTSDGARVNDVDDWKRVRRPELMEQFADQIYGRTPPLPTLPRFTVKEERMALEGKAHRRIVEIGMSGPGGELAFNVHLYRPAHDVRVKGIFVLIVNRDRSIITNAEANQLEFWPIREIVARGYVAAAFHNSDLALDSNPEGLSSGVFRVLGPPAEERPPDAWAVIAAWSWGASRVVDYLKSTPEFRALPIAVVGHSRGGKAALWCGAQDERVALTISNESGSTGAALARTKRGETVERINQQFPHWFNANYKRYNGREAELPVDQHMLIALMAPRLVYVASAASDLWADPLAEFGSCVAAEPAYRLFELAGLGTKEFPSTEQPLHRGAIGYHVRVGEHDLLELDWRRFMDFADRHWDSGRHDNATAKASSITPN